jgi:gamma-glutamylaminecyclotransferase
LQDLASFAAPQENRRLTHQQERTLVFVYGTLKQGFPNHSVLGESLCVGVCRTVEQFALYSSGIPFAVRGEPVSQIVGEAYLVNSPTLALLDDLEGHPHWYCRELVELIFSDSVKRPGWIYLFPHRRGKLIESGEFTRDLLP